MSRKIERSRPTQRQIPENTPAMPVQVEDLVAHTPSPESGNHAATDSQSNESTELPRYLRMVRKEARVRRDQADALAALRHRITTTRRARHASGEAITDNTLIRVALDVLLAHAYTLDGDTEDDIRASAHRLTESRNDKVTD
jgi:hypothetical protein